MSSNGVGAAGATAITPILSGSGGLTLALGSMSQSFDGTVDFVDYANPALGAGWNNNLTASGTTNVNGILGGWATVGVSLGQTNTGDWGALDNFGNIIPYANIGGG